jgi:hypothetical protein
MQKKLEINKLILKKKRSEQSRIKVRFLTIHGPGENSQSSGPVIGELELRMVVGSILA